jgi:alpha-glucosidase
MATDPPHGNVDRIRQDPATGAEFLCGWVSDPLDRAASSLTVRISQDGSVVGETVANLLRDDGYHGFEAACTGPSVAARAAAGCLVAAVVASDGREAPLHWHPPFLAGLRQLLLTDARAAAGAVLAVEPLPSGIAVQTGALYLRIVALRDDILRVRVSATAEILDEVSWAVPDAVRGATVPVRALRELDAAGFATASQVVRVMRGTGRLVITDAAGTDISADAAGWPAALEHGGFAIHKALQPDERFFGLGDQPGQLDRSGQSFTLWNTDAGWYQDATAPLYKSVPFFLGVRPGVCCGILLDNTWRSHFDFGRARRGVVSFGAEGGPADYYVLHGADPRTVLHAYAHLTGLPPLPPLWAFGFQQSRFSYMTQDAVLAVAEGLRSRSIPADVIYCDIDYQDRYRPFTVDWMAFPDFPGMVTALARLGLRTVAITDLHIARETADYEPYRSGLEGCHFVRGRNGEPYVGESWPGPAVFPDFTRADTRIWWGSLYQEFVGDGVAGFWNDMNEPAVASEASGTMPLDVVHRIAEPGYQERTAPHAEIHNVVGMQNIRATYEAMLAMRPHERPFVLTRASYAGGQRYGWTWTGDNSATAAHLRLTTPMLANAGLSGFAFIGADVGGFFGSPNPALLTRWFQVAAFHPLFRNHAFKDSAPREPWLDGADHEAIRRRFIEARYRLLPYIYTVAEEAARTGVPMLRPLFLEFPAMLTAARWYLRDSHTQFMLGDALMVAPPPFLDMVDDYVVTLPDGLWYDYWTGRRIEGDAIAVNPALSELPVFVRGGRIVPRQPLVQHTGEMPDGPLELAIYPGAGCSGAIYTDDGLSHDYQARWFTRQSFTCDGADGVLQVRLSARDGRYTPWWATIELLIHGMPSPAAEVTALRGTVQTVGHDTARGVVCVRLADCGGEDVVTIRFDSVGAAIPL